MRPPRKRNSPTRSPHLAPRTCAVSWRSTRFSPAKLNEFETLSYRLLNNVGIREQAPGARSAAADRRKKAFTLLVRAYSEVRSAVAFFRRAKGDLDDIVPSLYANRTNGRRKEPAPEPQPPAPGPVVAPPQPANVAPAAPGMPGANPFQN